MTRMSSAAGHYAPGASVPLSRKMVKRHERRQWRVVRRPGPLCSQRLCWGIPGWGQGREGRAASRQCMGEWGCQWAVRQPLSLCAYASPSPWGADDAQGTLAGSHESGKCLPARVLSPDSLFPACPTRPPSMNSVECHPCRLSC